MKVLLWTCCIQALNAAEKMPKKFVPKSYSVQQGVQDKLLLNDFESPECV